MHVSDSPPDADDDALLRLARGQHSALTELMSRWAPRVKGYFLRLTGQDAVAEDLAEETFVRLYESSRRYRPSGHARAFSTWLFGIAANLGREHLRWRKRHPTSPLEEAGEPMEERSPGDAARARETIDAVRAAIAALPDDLREVLILSEYEELSHVEIAEAVHCSPKAVERRLSRARGLLRRALAGWLDPS